jgi:PadR family transcriptional regulator PadR
MREPRGRVVAIGSQYPEANQALEFPFRLLAGLSLSDITYDGNWKPAMIGRLQEAILMALLNTKGEATTLELYEMLSGKHKPLLLSSIFIALDRMSRKKLVTRRKGDPLPQRGGKARLYYKITNSGRAALREVENTRTALSSLSKVRLANS